MGTKIELVREYWNSLFFTPYRTAVTVQSGTGAPTGTLADNIVILDRSGEGIPDTVRQNIRGPFQDGATYLGHRIEPRNIYWNIEVLGNSAANLQANINSLMRWLTTVRRPVYIGWPGSSNYDANVLILQYTLANGAVRCIKCFPTVVDMPVSKRQGRGFVQPMTLRFECAYPAFYNPFPKKVIFTGSGSVSYGQSFNYSGNYPDDGAIICIGGRDYFQDGTFGNRNPVTNFTLTVSNPGWSTYTSTISIGNTGGATAYPVVINCRTKTIQNITSANLNDTNDLPNLYIWPSPQFDQTGYITQSVNFFATYNAGAVTADVSIYSYEKFIGLESADH